MNWIKKKLRNWLGVRENEIGIVKLNQLYSGLTTMGIDVHFKEPHMILIFSKINGGQIRHIEAQFDDLRELNNLVKELKNRYKPAPPIFFDLPLGVPKNYFYED